MKWGILEFRFNGGEHIKVIGLAREGHILTHGPSDGVKAITGYSDCNLCNVKIFTDMLDYNDGMEDS